MNGQRPRCAVVGIGHPDRGDDAVGLVVADRVAALHLAAVDVVTAASPLDIVDVGLTYDRVVIVDALRSGAPPGAVGVHRLTAATLPGNAAALGTHDLGVREAVELGRALGRLPDELVLVSVEVDGVRIGAALSARVAGSVDTAVAAVLEVALGD